MNLAKDQDSWEASGMHEKPNITPIKLLPPKVRRVCDIAAADFGVTIQAILSGTKVGETSKARRQTIQTLKRQGYSTPQIGRWLGLHHTSILAAAKLPAAKPGVVSRHPTAEPVDVPYPDLSGEWAI